MDLSTLDAVDGPKALREGARGLVSAAMATVARRAEALAARSLPLLGVVIGSWPTEPGLAEESNLIDLPRVTGAPLWGAIPEGAGALTGEQFRAGVPDWFDLH